MGRRREDAHRPRVEQGVEVAVLERNEVEELGGRAQQSPFGKEQKTGGKIEADVS